MFTEALAEFQKAIDLDPDFAEAHVGLGTVYFEMEQLDEAERAVTEALRIDADSDAARQLLEAIKQARPAPPEPEPTKQTPKPTDTTDVEQDFSARTRFS